MDAIPQPADDDAPRTFELLDIDRRLLLCARCGAHPPVLEDRDGDELPVTVFVCVDGVWSPACRECLSLGERLALERRQLLGVLGLILEAEEGGEPTADLLEDAVCLVRRLGDLEREAAAAAGGPETWLSWPSSG